MFPYACLSVGCCRYFGFLGSLSLWLIIPSLFGLIVFIRARFVSDKHGETVFGLFIALWATIFLENWKRQQATLAAHWGMEGECSPVTFLWCNAADGVRVASLCVLLALAPPLSL